MSITAKELAAKLNLSAATVSMVLNNKPGISGSTRTRVLEAARKYGYEFRKAPESYVESTISFVIYKKHGVVVADTPFFTELIEGIVRTCQDSNCFPQISYYYEKESFDVQAERGNYHSCAGMILLGTEMEPADLRQFQQLRIPLVILDCYYDEVAADFVLINNTQGAFLATSYLIQSGHRKVGYLKSSVQISNFSERANGYYNALRRYGMDTSHTYVIEVTPQAERCYEDTMRYLKNEPALATAYFADNDIIAAAALRAFSMCGYRVPEDISVVGFDDMPICQLTTPALSTMSVPKHALGAAAVTRLLEKIQNPQSEHRKISLSTVLIRRNSVNLL